MFVDPDNGIGSTSQAYSRLGAKYVLLEELLPYIDRGQTLVIYHHLNRSATADLQIKNLIPQFHGILGLPHKLMVLRYRRGSARVFILCVAATHSYLLESRTQFFLTRLWNQHFESYSALSQG